jgi:hypothetical protein
MDGGGRAASGTAAESNAGSSCREVENGRPHAPGKAWPRRASRHGPCIRTSLYIKTRFPDGANTPSPLASRFRGRPTGHPCPACDRRVPARRPSGSIALVLYARARHTGEKTDWRTRSMCRTHKCRGRPRMTESGHRQALGERSAPLARRFVFDVNRPLRRAEHRREGEVGPEGASEGSRACASAIGISRMRTP